MKFNTTTLSGYREYTPKQQSSFNKIKNIIISEYEKAGFFSLDTPRIYRKDIIFAKVGDETQKQIYELTKGDSELVLPFDHTVPLAIYVANNQNEITFPFKRSHVGKVHRGEKAQAGRAREFYQADIDIIGRENLDLFFDAEVVQVAYSIFKKLNIGNFTINLNNRRLLREFFNLYSISDEDFDELVLYLDKIDKIGKDEVLAQISASLGLNCYESVIKLNEINSADSNIEKLSLLKAQSSDENSDFNEALNELETVYKQAISIGTSENNLDINLTIVRGLDYYTGTVYETFFEDYPDFGSICSGGRYDDLTSIYTTNNFPGVGISIGLTRLFDLVIEEKLVGNFYEPSVDILFINLTDDLTYSAEVIEDLRNDGYRIQIIPNSFGIKKAMKYASDLDAKFTVIIGEDEISKNKFAVKDMNTGEQFNLTKKELIDLI